MDPPSEDRIRYLVDKYTNYKKRTSRSPKKPRVSKLFKVKQ